MNRVEIKFSDAIVDAAYRIVAQSCITNEADRQMFSIICTICDNHGISVRKYMDMIGEINKLMEENNNAHNQ